MGDRVEVRYVGLDNSECVERFDYCLVVIGLRPNVASINAANYPDVKPGKSTIGTTGLGVVFTDPQIAMVGLGPDKLFLASVAEM